VAVAVVAVVAVVVVAVVAVVVVAVVAVDLVAVDLVAVVVVDRLRRFHRLLPRAYHQRQINLLSANQAKSAVRVAVVVAV
jgi:hypothetical protein